MSEKQTVKFCLQVKAKDLFRFFLVYNYRNLSGVLCVIVSFASLIFLITTFSENETLTNGILFFIALYFTVIRPVILFQKAKKDNRCHS